jgi:hypothetical protein
MAGRLARQNSLLKGAGILNGLCHDVRKVTYDEKENYSKALIQPRLKYLTKGLIKIVV